LNFWYYGQGSNRPVQISVSATTRLPRPIPSQVEARLERRVQHEAPGAAPNAAVWGNEVGDGTANGIPGWGNDELEYYTPGGANASTDGKGNLVITTAKADGSLTCYYGPCQYTSARLLTKNRLRGRLRPRRGARQGAEWRRVSGLRSGCSARTSTRSAGRRPARSTSWSTSAACPTRFSAPFTAPATPAARATARLSTSASRSPTPSTFAVEWQPDKITWFFDGAPYFTATPSDPFLQGKQWVFNHPFFLLLNVAVGGNFGGAVSPDTVFPAEDPGRLRPRLPGKAGREKILCRLRR
jgi:beta-glucanase (GH16 family)